MTEDRKTEIAANWSRAEDSIAAAKMLADSGYYDFVASRAYYAGFYAAAAALLTEGISRAIETAEQFVAALKRLVA